MGGLRPPLPPAVEVRSLRNWTTREVHINTILTIITTILLLLFWILKLTLLHTIKMHLF